MFKVHRNFDLSTGVKNNTIAVVNDGNGGISVVYHKTLVVEARSSKITLRDGGWNTVSTRLVINQALSEMGHRVYLFTKKGETLISINGVVKPFVSGMTLNRRKLLSVIQSQEAA